MKLLDNKTVLVTGGSRGIGSSIVLKLAEHGANIVFTYLSSSKQADIVIRNTQKYDVKVLAVQSDASKYNDCEKLIDLVLKEFGTISSAFFWPLKSLKADFSRFEGVLAPFELDLRLFWLYLRPNRGCLSKDL